MAESITFLRVFIASPGGLDDERKAFRKVLRRYNKREARRRKFQFEAVGWEDTLGGYGQRPQSLINEDLKTCDFFVLVMHDRWGTPTGEYTSGSEEEYRRAEAHFEDPEADMRQLAVLFKAVDPRQLADPGPELQKVNKFRKQLEAERKVLYKTFDELQVFERLLEDFLARWLYDYEHGVVRPPDPLPVSRPVDEDPSEDKPEKDPLLGEAKKLANEGKLVEAEVLFSKAITRGHPEAWRQFGNFLSRLGRLRQAEAMYEHVVKLAEEHGKKWEAQGLNNLGLIYQRRGELEKAEDMHNKALAISQQIGNKEGMAIQYGNLGVIYKTRGELEKAEDMQNKALEINQQLGNKEGMASQYGNLGVIYWTRGEIEKAEDMHNKSLEIEKQLGRKEGMARQYGNLGLIYQTRGELERAEEFYLRAVETYTSGGIFGEGLAITYGNLGHLEESRSNPSAARSYYEKALDLWKTLGNPVWVAKLEALLAALDD